MRLIDLDSEYIKETLYRTGFKSRKDIEDWLNAAPVVNTVPIVRCKNCRFLIEHKDGTLGCYRNFMDYTELDNYCNYGERSKRCGLNSNTG